MLMPGSMYLQWPFRNELRSTVKDCRQYSGLITAPISLIALLVVLLIGACSDSAGSSGGSGSSGLSAPGGLSVSFIDANTLRVSWNSASGASEYQIYRNDAADPAEGSLRSRVTTVSATEYDDGNLIASRDYWYWLRACTSNTNCSDFSGSASGSTIPDSLAPSDFSAIPGEEKITLSWTVVSDYTYNLLRSTNDCLGSNVDDINDFDDYQTLCSNPELYTKIKPPVEQDELNHELTYYYWLEVADDFGNKSYTYASATPDELDYESGTIIWEQSLGGVVSLAPAFDSERRVLYVAVGNELHAFDIDSGAEIWDDPFEASNNIAADPIVDLDGYIYIASTNSADNSVVYRVNPNGPSDSSDAWTRANSSATGISVGVALKQEDSNSGVFYYSDDDGKIYAIDDLTSGGVSLHANLEKKITTPISIDIYGNLYMGNEDRDLLMRSMQSTSTASINSEISGSIALGIDSTAFFGANQNAYSYDSGANRIWASSSLGTIAASAVLAPSNGAVYIPGNNKLYALSASSGQEIWSYTFNNSTIGSTAAVTDTNGYVYLGDSEGDVHVIDSSGNFIAQYSTGRSSAISTPMSLDDSKSILYFGAGRRIYAIQAHGSLNKESYWVKYRGNVRNTGYITDSESIGADITYAQQELDNSNLVFSGDWVSDTTSPRQGSSSMRSRPDLGDREISCISTMPQQNGTLSFYWKVSSEIFDVLKLTITTNGVSEKIASISGTQEWTQPTQTLEEGTITTLTIEVAAGAIVEWCYEKDYTISTGSDAGWLDNVGFN